MKRCCKKKIPAKSWTSHMKSWQASAAATPCFVLPALFFSHKTMFLAAFQHFSMYLSYIKMSLWIEIILLNVKGKEWNILKILGILPACKLCIVKTWAIWRRALYDIEILFQSLHLEQYLGLNISSNTPVSTFQFHWIAIYTTISNSFLW